MNIQKRIEEGRNKYLNKLGHYTGFAGADFLEGANFGLMLAVEILRSKEAHFFGANLADWLETKMKEQGEG